MFFSQFAKDSGKYHEEKKLRVVLSGPAHSPVLLPLNGLLKQDPCPEIFSQEEQLLSGVENTPPAHVVREIVTLSFNLISTLLKGAFLSRDLGP